MQTKKNSMERRTFMKFTFKHRRTIAKFTLITVFIVLLLAFTFTVFAAPRYDGSFQDNIMLTADDIGHSISSTGRYGK